MTVLVEISDLSFSYGTERVLDGVHLSVRQGDLVCVVGANGCGKTTLLRLVAGLLRAEPGRVLCFGTDPATTKRRELARRLSFLPQDYRQVFPFSSLEIVLMGRYAHRSRGLVDRESDGDREAAMAAMRRCDVGHLAERPFDELSGGEQRRVLLAQAFCQRAELILLDEPTAALDPAHALEIFSAVQRETKTGDTTAVVVTHDLNLAARFASRIAVMDQGAMIADDVPTAVLASGAIQSAFKIDIFVDHLPDSDIPFVVPVDRHN